MAEYAADGGPTSNDVRCRPVDIRPDRSWAQRSSPPSLSIARSSGTVVVTVRGHLEAEGSRWLGAVLADLIDGQGNLSVVVDLHDADATDPDCLWMLTEAAERARRRGGTMTVDAAPAVTPTVQLRGLDSFVGEASTSVLSSSGSVLRRPL